MKKHRANYILRDFYNALNNGITHTEAKECFSLTDQEADYMFSLCEKVYGKCKNENTRKSFLEVTVEEPEPIEDKIQRPPAIYSNRSRDEVIDFYLNHVL